MRVFAAIALPEDIRDAIHNLGERLRKKGDAASWVRSENMHLTLRFYGELTEEQVKCLIDDLSAALPGHDKPLLLARGLGAFPSITRPTILWAGVDTVSGHLIPIQHCTEAAAQALELPKERKAFHPHITIARLRKPGTKVACQPLLAACQETGAVPEFGQEFPVHNVLLLRSVLSSKGSMYHILREIAL
ncbi:MAG: RNA 2',3'-cyclic phosphodiesterase [Candidatus Hydrogenedentales bacterium]|jgi:2'-5' RNA ligase